MKVLYVGHVFGNVFRGGAEIQMEKTANAINNLSNEITIDIFNNSYELNEILQYDIIHFFKSNEYYLELAKFLKNMNKKIVLSSIYLPNSMEKFNKLKIKAAFKISRYLPQQLSIQKRIIKLWELSDKIYPNTNDELYFISSIVKNINKFKKIPNATENMSDFLDLNTIEETLRKYNIFKLNKSYILNVGRIEPRKNQLSIIKIAKKNNWPLVIIGSIGDKEYYDACLKEIKERDNIIILNGIKSRNELANIYYSAKVFCMPSTMETPGLAALEACSIGTDCVVTSLGGTKEYFKGYVSYVNPFDLMEIQNTVAIKMGKDWTKNNSMKKFITSNYSYKNIGKQYISEYIKFNNNEN
ncbi:glycosyltransferase family 4 protein [Clostridium tetanomorphum]|uniref:Glycosyltransferase family 4 protein n=1 Tax=Clostridium tetanomorphum TaxID=1553 RepID=A0A923EB07_CLOTT|nr:glycosyltransferase family 4 protein [Clostridium tetanomorphum]MBC2397115.1 glycosyltransferase family 4 protein [Clostridium tetanomorphum]NRZ99041.1 glycosyltransferase involved in cell wall biosynthesis [Clostridium tetanomorphum]